MTIDDRSYESTNCRWFAFQAMRRAQVGDLDVVTTNRLVIEDTVVMWRVKFTNTGVTAKSFPVALTVDPGWKPVNREFIGPGEIRATSDKWKMDYAYRFFDLPQNKTDGQFAEWQVDVAPSESREIRQAVYLVSEHAGVAIFAEPPSIDCRLRGVVIRPLADKSLCFDTCLIMRADQGSRAVNEFGRAFLKKYAPQRLPPATDGFASACLTSLPDPHDLGSRG